MEAVDCSGIQKGGITNKWCLLWAPEEQSPVFAMPAIN